MGLATLMVQLLTNFSLTSQFSEDFTANFKSHYWQTLGSNLEKLNYQLIVTIIIRKFCLIRGSFQLIEKKFIFLKYLFDKKFMNKDFDFL
jgi:hypothetical protein